MAICKELLCSYISTCFFHMGKCSMLNKILCYSYGWMNFHHKLHIPKTYLQWCSKQSKASWWHSYAIKYRPWRLHVCIPCSWIAQAVPHSAHIFEIGCGSGANLLWLHQKGFYNLEGSDIETSAVDMCHLLNSYYKANINAFIDDALHPRQLPQNIDALLSVNWLYHIPGASLENVFNTYRDSLKPNGYIVFDCISSRYNAMSNNQYHTSDTRLPVADRRPSEYTFRMSMQEVENSAAKHGFSIVRKKELRTWTTRNGYMAQHLQ